MPTKIEWVTNPDGTKGETWNPVTGCSKVSPGCTNCYAEAMCRRFWRQWDRDPPPDHFKVKLHPERLEQPMKWKKPRRIFVCSMSDFFHPEVPLEFQVQVFSVIRRCPQHTFQILTKREDQLAIMDYACGIPKLPNMHLLVTAENQECADRRIAELLKVPASVRGVSLEPLLGPIDIAPFLRPYPSMLGLVPALNWVIVGAESGPNRRPMELDWAIDLVRQCQAAGVACFVKQIPVNGKVSKDPSEWPEELRVREYPR